ncbi:MFS transporter [Candidatus Gottesmanbacteria bacterium]|nr:MFS transporter [Candidatus Gottesmanbacteria bacterium]
MHRNIRLLALFNFFTDFHLYTAILIIYFARVTGSYTLAMSLFSVVMVSSALFEIPTGIFSDYIGRKRTVMLGAFSSVFAVICYAIGMNYWILFTGALFEGLQRAWYSGNNDALLYETLAQSGHKDAYSHYLGKVSAMFQMAAAAGIIIGGILATRSFALIMWLSVIPQLICLLLSFFITEPNKRQHHNSNISMHLVAAATNIWSNRSLRLLSINRIVNYAVGESTYHFRAAFVNTLWPLWAVGFSTALSSIGAAASYWYSGRLITNIGSYRLLLMANLYSKIVNIASVAVATVFSPIIIASTSLFFGISEVANSQLMQNEFTHDQRATLASITSFLGNLAFGAYAVLLGLLADSFGPTRALIIAYISYVPTLAINWILYEGHKHSA